LDGNEFVDNKVNGNLNNFAANLKP